MVIEEGLAIFTGCMAALRPLLKYVPFGENSKSGRSSRPSKSAGGAQQFKVGQMGAVKALGNIEYGDSESNRAVLVYQEESGIRKTVRYEVCYPEVLHVPGSGMAGHSEGFPNGAFHAHGQI